MYQINKTAISWLPPEQIEPAAMQQIVKIASMPFIYKHVAIMPDCHVGMGGDGRLVHPDRRGNNPGGGGCGHRLRHGSRADAAVP